MALMGRVDKKPGRKYVCILFDVHLVGQRIWAGAFRELMSCLVWFVSEGGVTFKGVFWVSTLWVLFSGDLGGARVPF